MKNIKIIELARNEQQIEKKVSNYINGTDI